MSLFATDVPKVLLVSASLLASQIVTAKTWSLTPTYSDVGFTLNLIGGLEPRGEFQEFSGTVLYDPANKNNSKFNLKIATSSLDIRLPDMFDGLAKSDFFQTKKHPYMTFQSTRVRFTSARKARIVGNLTFMGRTRPIMMTANITPVLSKNKKVTRLQFQGDTTIKRSHFNFRVPVLGLSDNILVHLKGELLPKQ